MSAIIAFVALTAATYFPSQGVVTTQMSHNSTKHVVSFVGDIEHISVQNQPNGGEAFLAFDLPRHDPVLGRLQKIRVTIYKLTRWRWRFENLDVVMPLDTVVFHKGLDVMHLEALIHHHDLYTSPWSGNQMVGFHQNVGQYDGTIDYAGSGGYTSPWYVQGWENVVREFTTPLHLGDFTGRGPMPCELSVANLYGSQTAFTDYRDKFEGTAYVRVTVEYEW